MDEKISLESIALYGDAYAEKVIDGYFSKNDVITGQDIRSLCDVHQVNLFVIRELFKAWREETSRLKSPYFDYENEEVKEALLNYTSVLSNHISIDRRRFSPLLKKAVSQTLMVIFDPYDFYSLLVSGRDNQLSVASFREEIKYLKINKAPLDRMLEKLEEQAKETVSGNEAFAVLDQILEEVNFTPEDVEDYIEKFSLIHPLDPSSFYVTTGLNKPKEVLEEQVKIHQEAQTIRQEEKVVTRENKVLVEQKTIFSTERTVEPSRVHDSLFSAKQPALVDNFRKIARIKDSLTINQKFMFTKVLFYGDFESFSRAIDDIDQLPDMTAALNYLEGHSSGWDRESSEFHEFMELIEKRFS